MRLKSWKERSRAKVKIEQQEVLIAELKEAHTKEVRLEQVEVMLQDLQLTDF